MMPDRDGLVLRVLHGSATVREGTLCVTATNTHPAQPIELEVGIVGGRLESVEVTELVGESLTAHNTAARPDAVGLLPSRRVEVAGGTLRIPMRAASVVRLRGRLV